MTTIDFSIASGEDIPIEERSTHEITHVAGVQITPDNVDVANPAFDMTPAKFITAIITDKGIAYPPFIESLASLKSR
jgi:methylthioribose-1-phosphate isomerase